MFHKYFVVFITLILISSSAFGVGADHKQGTLPAHEGWPDGTYEVVNLPCRVHGFWINSSDTLFYKDGTVVLNEVLQKIDAIEGLTVQVIIHPGKGVAKSPWSKEVLDSADWAVTLSGREALTVKQNQVLVDVWLGGSVLLDDLKIPRKIEVKSGNEIEAYIEKRSVEPGK